MKSNKLQFATVREDPQLELDLIQKFNLRSAVLIGSGGCTALSIKAYSPNFRLDLIEPNPAQVRSIQEKIKILSEMKQEDARKIIGANINSPLIEAGNFESLFKMLRTFIYEFVLSEKEFQTLLEAGDPEQWEECFQHPYWKTAFELYFSDSILVTMFGPAAIQYAPKNSYPQYFRELLERGLKREAAEDNYFLHHIFFGHYFEREESLPFYLQWEIENMEMSFHPCFAQEFTGYGNFDLVGLSNILDWSAPEDVLRIAQLVSDSMRKGAVLFYRQLNNSSDFKQYFKGFVWREELENKFLQKDRSLFYSKICIGIKEQ